MTTRCLLRVLVQSGPFDAAAETASIVQGRTDIGAVVSFIGFCRDEGGRLAALELEHYPTMAEAEMTRIAKEAGDRWPLSAITLIHRHGRIAPGEQIVLVVAASPHRRAAFEAAAFVIDFLKTDAPFWKKEHPADGSAPEWIGTRATDAEAAERWKRR